MIPLVDESWVKMDGQYRRIIVADGVSYDFRVRRHRKYKSKWELADAEHHWVVLGTSSTAKDLMERVDARFGPSNWSKRY